MYGTFLRTWQKPIRCGNFSHNTTILWQWRDLCTISCQYLHLDRSRARTKAKYKFFHYKPMWSLHKNRLLFDFPSLFEPFNTVRKKSLRIFNIVFPGFGKNSALRSRHVLSSNFKTDYSWQTEWQYDFNGNEMKDCFSIKNCFKTPPLPVKPTSSKSIWSVCFDEMWWRRHSLLSNYVGSTNSMKLFSLSIRFTSNFIYDAIDLQLRSLFQDCFLWDFHRSAVKLKIYKLKWKQYAIICSAWSRWSITKYTYQS